MLYANAGRSRDRRDITTQLKTRATKIPARAQGVCVRMDRILNCLSFAAVAAAAAEPHPRPA